MFCSKCGSQLSEETKFCHNCGIPISQTNINQIQEKKIATFPLRAVILASIVTIIAIILFVSASSVYNSGTIHIMGTAITDPSAKKESGILAGIGAVVFIYALLRWLKAFLDYKF